MKHKVGLGPDIMNRLKVMGRATFLNRCRDKEGSQWDKCDSVVSDVILEAAANLSEEKVLRWVRGGE